MSGQGSLALLVLVLVSFALGSKASRQDSDTKALDDLLDKIADGLANNDNCKDVVVPANCRITEDCVKITCEDNVFGKDMVVTSKLNRCDDPVTVTITVQDKNGNTDWTHVFTSGGDVAIPGMTFSGSGLFIKVELDPENDQLALKVSLFAIELFSVKLPISTEHCGFVRWWQQRNSAERIALVIAFLIAVLSVITAVVSVAVAAAVNPAREGAIE
ncbi:uncharacterized protein [Montipora capricornis]|uniref:uncharacterized protein n=1 Tax=Montipora capricornis TaxID=246305 RepID=UPI0035F1E5BA